MLDNNLKLADLPQGVIDECNQYYTTTFDHYGVIDDKCVSRCLDYKEQRPIELGHEFIDVNTFEPRTVTESELSEYWYRRGYIVRGIINDELKTLDVRSVWYSDAIRSDAINEVLDTIGWA